MFVFILPRWHDETQGLHQSIGGVNAKPSPFASINLDAFESYGKILLGDSYTAGATLAVGCKCVRQFSF